MYLPVYLIIGFLLLMPLSSVLAQEDEETTYEPETADAYDQALLRFNNNIQSYDSWNAFKTAVLAKISPGKLGHCYSLTGGMLNPLEVFRVKFEGLEGDGWQKTSGKGWRVSRKDRSFTEYRVNLKASMLSRIEGVKPRFFFGGTQRICEFEM